MGSKSYISGNWRYSIRVHHVYSFLSSQEKNQEIHFVDLQDPVLCHGEKQRVYKPRPEFRFRRHEFPALREEQGFELTFCHNN